MNESQANNQRPQFQLYRNGRLATMQAEQGWDPHDNWVIVTQDTRIAWIGKFDNLPTPFHVLIDNEHDMQGKLVTPGLIDCHTHLVYGGCRDQEFELRLQGASYEEIARAGGGIRSTVRATRSASADKLLEAACRRANIFKEHGVTTIEIKSGYGLDYETETTCLRVARQVGRESGVDVQVTCLAAHTTPPEFEGRSADYIEAVCQWLPLWQAEGLIDAVDVFCDTVGFSLNETRRLLECATALGLPVKCHAEQLSLQGGARLAAEFGALSCDHLEYVDDRGIAAMRVAGTVAVLLPGAYYTLRQDTPPPVDKLRQAGVPLAVATDHNPGSSPLLSLALAGNLACTLFGLTPQEAVFGMTVQAARALGLNDRGSLIAGKLAHFTVWDYDHPREIVYWIG